MRKSTKTTVLIVACAAILVVVLGFFTSGFQKWSKDDVLSKITPQVNEENYYSEDCVTLVDTNDGKGVKIDVNEDNGVITLNGAAASDLTGDNAYKVGKLTLEAGEYTFTSYDYASYGGVYLTASTGTSVINFDFTPGNTVELKSTTEITIYPGRGDRNSYSTNLPGFEHSSYIYQKFTAADLFEEALKAFIEKLDQAEGEK